MLIAQVTDTHIVDPAIENEQYVDNNQRLADAVAAVGNEMPSIDLVLMTGDLTNIGTDEEYAALTDLLAPLEGRVLPIPGNHDDRQRMREAFPKLPWADASHASWAVDHDDLRIVGLDSTVPGLPGAEVDPERLDWLRSVISSASDRCVLALHHPPFATGIEWMDQSGFIGLDALTTLLTEHPVERILSGHMHRSIQSTVAGIPATTAPPTVHGVDLDLRPDAPVSLIRDPPAYLVHRVIPGAWVTHTRYFDTGEARIHPTWADID